MMVGGGGWTHGVAGIFVVDNRVLGIFLDLCCWYCGFTDLKHKFLSLVAGLVFFIHFPFEIKKRKKKIWPNKIF